MLKVNINHAIQPKKLIQSTLREKCPYSEFFWSLFSSIWTEYGDTGPHFPAFGLNMEILRISPYLVRMRENTDQKSPNTYTSCKVILLRHSLNGFTA